MPSLGILEGGFQGMHVGEERQDQGRRGSLPLGLRGQIEVTSWQGLPFKLSFHLSRHTFATNALNNGMRIEHVSKLMDHRDISTTQVYAKIISEELDKAVDNYIY